MRSYAAFAITMTVLTMGPTVQAQTCYTPITSWQGGFSISGSAKGACPDFQPGATCDIDQSANVDVEMFLSLATCDMVMWAGQSNNISSFSVNDTGSYQCSEDPAETETVTVTGQTGGIGGSFLLAEVSSGAPGLNCGKMPCYLFVPADGGNSKFTESGCESKSANVQWALEPRAGGAWPLGFTLPSSVQPLTASPPAFQAAQDLFNDTSTSWNFSFTLNPIYNPDDDCNQDGNSTIGCQTQSLGEDVPIVGTGFKLHYESDRAPGAPGNAMAGAAAAMIGGWTLSVHHAYDPNTNTLFLGDGRQRNGYQLGTPVSYNNNLLLTSEDGSEVYVFSGATGQHLQTLRPLTGALVYQFGYDLNGELITVTDATGNVTTIQRNSSEQPTAIISPYGQTTTLTLDSNGFLSKITDPLGNSETLVNTSTGQLTSRTDENGNTFTYTYDTNNRLANDGDPVGGYTSLTRTEATSGIGWTVEETTSMGRNSSYQSTLDLPWLQTGTSTQSEQHTNIWPDGLQATSSKTQQGSEITESVDLPDGTSSSDTLGPDPVWGLQVPVLTSETLTQGNLKMTTSESRSTTLATSGDPFTVSNSTDTQTINGRTYESVFTGSTRTWLNTSPAGRTLTIGLDSLERLASTQIEGLTATDFAYDTRGRLSTVTRGTRTATFAYDTDGRLASLTDPLSLKTSFTYDADGRLLTTTLADGRIIHFTHDANGNPTSVTPPGKSAQTFTYTPVNLVSEYTPPTLSGTGSTTYAYNTDRDLTQITRPDGKTISFDYDSAGRLSSLITPTETVEYTYSSTSGNLVTASITSGEALAYDYNGPLPTSTQWTGTIAGSVSRAFNDNFWVTSKSINGGNTVPFTYDDDGLLTEAGALTIARNSENGLITGTTLGSATDTRTYNSFGELTRYTASYKGSALDNVTYTRDADGRISSKTETIGGKTNTYVYSYDLAGRLMGVTQNGKAVSSYAYDTNSNRLKATTASGTVSATYDAQDRLLTYGTAAYTYTANGELETQTVGRQKTTYQYDVLGNLTAVTLPNHTAITYIVDAENHRIGKKVNGVLTEGFLYDGSRIVAQLNGSNAIVSHFVYGTNSNAPDYMISGGVTYRIISDQLGSPRLVVNAWTGAIAEEITYDEFGNVTSDTKPGFQPFGFAGGLYDQDTKLVRFGARDYNPAVGRWTAKDPILFRGRDTDLYGYAWGDPVNITDRLGLEGRCLRSPDFYSLSFGAGLVLGAQDTLTIDRNGTVYFGGGPAVGTPGMSASLTANWLCACQQPTDRQLNSFLTEWSYGAGGGYGLGAQGSYTPNNGVAVGLGLSTPGGGGGVSYTGNLSEAVQSFLGLVVNGIYGLYGD
jgi:RHS repeat-associated protein